MRPFSRKLISHFRRNDEGSIAIMLALSLIPITVTLGVSVDMARAHAAKSGLQAAVDSAAIAAAISYNADKNTNNAVTAAKNAFNASKGKSAGTLAEPVVNTATGKITLAAITSQSNYFMGILNSGSSTTIGAKAEVSAASPQKTGLGMNLEVSLMLDVTVSMSQNSGTPNLTKLAAMQQAAKELIDTVIHTSQTPYKSRVALVPFSSGVNVGSRFTAINGAAAPNSGTKSSPKLWQSVVERAGAYAFTEDGPSSSSYFPSFYSKKNNAFGPYASYVKDMTANTPVNAVVTPLSSNKASLKSLISNYSADGTTAGHLGTAFSWYTLSPYWAGVWGTDGAAEVYDPKKTLKVAVLMSDFDYNSYYQSGNGSSAAQAKTLCTNMKTAGVVVYTIGFQINNNDAVAKDLFESCASGAANRLTASNGTEMIAAFNKIATTVVEKASVGTALYISK